MKRITSIQIENFRAFYGSYAPIRLPQGQNLLIYGENGSGKSSIFKALSNFIASSRNANLSYVKNRHQNLGVGFINCVFNEFDLATRSITSPIGQIITFGSDIVSTDTFNFLNDTDLIKGFLDYRSLLNVYNHKEENPNLFNLIVGELLLNYIPPGGTYAFGTKWKELTINLSEVYNRMERRHKIALSELPAFESSLRTAFERILLQLNALLIKYFKLNIRVWYNLLPTTPYNYTSGNWHATADLRLELTLNGIDVLNQNDYLNEARLSALSICLYLSALMRNPQTFEYKILFLDDIFVGLDAGNRIPILNILQNEFSDYQIFISTYDRHWFELAKRHFESELAGEWLTAEFYVGKEKVGTTNFEKPIIVNGLTNYEKAVQYLHDRSKPDYPASANYFRKALEELIQKYIPAWELVGEENTQLPEYKLGPLMIRAKRFLTNSSSDTKIINRISSLLSALLHPLSHHEISSPIYKNELLIIEKLIPDFKRQLITLDIENNFKCSILEGRNKIVIEYMIDAATNHISIYELRTTEPLSLKINPGGPPIISKVHCVVEKCWGQNSGTVIPGTRKEFSSLEKNNPDLNFDSLEEAFDKLYTKMTKIPAIGNFPKPANYLTAMRYLDTERNLQPVLNAIVW